MNYRHLMVIVNPMKGIICRLPLEEHGQITTDLERSKRN